MRISQVPQVLVNNFRQRGRREIMVIMAGVVVTVGRHRMGGGLVVVGRRRRLW